MQLSREALLRAYRQMKLIREFEERHLQHINRHNWYACLARELREGEL
jgi:TPP-dependent pyruvate/acetoin dehydrogenase alpha subunit